MTLATTLDAVAGPEAHALPRIDLVLLDLDLGAAGFADEGMVAALQRQGTAVLVVTALGSPRHVQRMLRAGVVGVVAKNDSMKNLRAAVDAALRGEQWMSPVLAQAIAVDSVACRPKLSDQEQLALQLYACGLKLDSVARRMGVATSTAKQYIDRVRDKYAKLGQQVRTKTELSAIAAEDGFVTRAPNIDTTVE